MSVSWEGERQITVQFGGRRRGGDFDLYSESNKRKWGGIFLVLAILFGASETNSFVPIDNHGVLRLSRTAILCGNTVSRGLKVGCKLRLADGRPETLVALRMTLNKESSRQVRKTLARRRVDRVVLMYQTELVS